MPCGARGVAKVAKGSAVSAEREPGPQPRPARRLERPAGKWKKNGKALQSCSKALKVSRFSMVLALWPRRGAVSSCQVQRRDAVTRVEGGANGKVSPILRWQLLPPTNQHAWRRVRNQGRASACTQGAQSSQSLASVAESLIKPAASKHSQCC